MNETGMGRSMAFSSTGVVGQEEQATKTAVKVENNGWADVDMYLLRGSSRIRLGMVTSMGSQHFTIPEAYLNGSTDLRLYAHPIGGFAENDWVTQPLLISPGQQVALTLQNNLNLSSYSIF